MTATRSYYELHPEAFDEAAKAHEVRSRLRQLLWDGAQYVPDVLAAGTERDLDDPRAIILRREVHAAEVRLLDFLAASGVVV